MKNIKILYLKIFIFGGKIFGIFKKRHVFVMYTLHTLVFNRQLNSAI